MKRLVSKILTAVFFALAPFIVAAVSNPFVEAQKDFGTVQAKSGVGSASLEIVVGKIIQGALSLLGVVFFALMVWAGYRWMMAHGEQEEIDKAKRMLSSSVIGFAIVLAAYAITAFVISRFESAGVLK